MVIKTNSITIICGKYSFTKLKSHKIAQYKFLNMQNKEKELKYSRKS